MKKVITLIIASIISTSTFSQDELDSMKVIKAYNLIFHIDSLIEINEFDNAIEIGELAVGLHSDFITEFKTYHAYSSKGAFFYSKKEYTISKSAIKNAIKHLLKIDVDVNLLLIEAYYNKGLCNFFLKQFYDAIYDFHHIIELDSKNNLAYYNIGSCWYNLKNYDKACEFYTKSFQYGYDIDRGIIEFCNKNTNTSNSSKKIYVCGGDYSKKYHSSNNCRGLNNCKGGLYYYSTQSEALKSGFTSCEICWY